MVLEILAPPKAASERLSSPARKTILEARRVTVRFQSGHREIAALEDVSFSLAEGERLSIVGKSGCGKSSLLRAIGGFLKPSAGELLLHGLPIVKPAADSMMVFQDFDQLFGWKTVAENVRFALRTARGLSRAEAREKADLWLERVGLRAFAGDYPHALLGGMRSRVAIARASAIEPQLLLMDEPFAALDALTSRAVQDELLRLLDVTGAALILVTHAIGEALRLGDRVLALTPHPGRVAADLQVPASASPAELAAIEEHVLRQVLRGGAETPRSGTFS